MKKNQQGFTIVEGLLIIIALTLIGFVGFYVYNQNKNENDDSSAVSTQKADQLKTETKPTETLKDETQNWFLYEPPGKTYKIRLADGWKLSRTSGTDFIYAWDATSLQYTKGTLATVNEVMGGRDGASIAFNLLTVSGAGEANVRGDKQTSLKTNAGVEVSKYRFVQAETPEGPDLRKGSVEYKYVLSNNGKTIVVIHDENAGEPNNVDIVERAIRTLQF